MEKLDSIVIAGLIDRLLAPERLVIILESLATRRAQKSMAADERIKGLEERVTETQERLRRLYAMVEDGSVATDSMLKQRIAVLQAERESAEAALERARGTMRMPVDLAPDRIEAFGRLMRERLVSGDVKFRKAYLGAIIDRIEVGDGTIRIQGRKDVLEQVVLSNGGPEPGVRSFVRKWRSLRESNSSFQIENLTS